MLSCSYWMAKAARGFRAAFTCAGPATWQMALGGGLLRAFQQDPRKEVVAVYTSAFRFGCQTLIMGIPIEERPIMGAPAPERGGHLR
jgi:hypothetical protein